MNFVRSLLPFITAPALRAAGTAFARRVAVAVVAQEIDRRTAKLDINDTAERVQIDVLAYVKDRLQLLI